MFFYRMQIDSTLIAFERCQEKLNASALPGQQSRLTCVIFCDIKCWNPLSEVV